MSSSWAASFGGNAEAQLSPPEAAVSNDVGLLSLVAGKRAALRPLRPQEVVPALLLVRDLHVQSVHEGHHSLLGPPGAVDPWRRLSPEECLRHGLGGRHDPDHGT